MKPIEWETCSIERWSGSIHSDLSSTADEASMLHALLGRVERAKRAADESIARVADVPGPHVADNAIFMAHYDAHCMDREALFDALRRLDAVRSKKGSTYVFR